MKILGIDPGLARCGWGVVDYKASRFTTLGYGAIITPADMEFGERLVTLHRSICEIIAHFSPEQVAIEELFFLNNQKTAMAVSQARGVLVLGAAQAGLPVAEYTPPQVKQAVVGYGRAEKSQVIVMVSSILGLVNSPKLDDTADALALAICHAHSHRT